MKLFITIAIILSIVTFIFIKSKNSLSSAIESAKSSTPLKAIEKYKDYFKEYPINITGNFFDDLVTYIWYKEGGLSKLESDSASKHPTNVSFTNPYNGVVSDKWHTNKGITFETFENLAAKLGYNKDAKTFYEMPKDVWLKIYQNGFANPMKVTDSTLVNSYLSLWAWGSGVGGAKKLLAGFNKDIGDVKVMLKSEGEKETVKKLAGYRILNFDAIAARKINEVERSNKSKEEKEKLVSQLISTRKAWINGVLNFLSHFIN